MPPPPAGDEQPPDVTRSADDAVPPHRPTVDELGEWSFPASDPPATWTWDVDREP